MKRDERCFIAACISLILAIFLSSGIAGADNVKGNRLDSIGFSNPITVTRNSWASITNSASVFTKATAPVSYPELRIEEMLEGWHDAYLLLLLEDENRSKALLREAMVPSKLNDNWWSLLSPIGQALILVGLLLLFSGALYWSDNQLLKQIKEDNK